MTKTSYSTHLFTDFFHLRKSLIFIPVAEFFPVFCNKPHKYWISFYKIIFNRVLQSIQYYFSCDHHWFFVFTATQYSVKVILCAALIFKNNKRCIHEFYINIKYNKHIHKNATNIFETLLQLTFEKRAAKLGQMIWQHRNEHSFNMFSGVFKTTWWSIYFNKCSFIICPNIWQNLRPLAANIS